MDRGKRHHHLSPDDHHPKAKTLSEGCLPDQDPAIQKVTS
jgi:hypothetical protein